MRSLQRHVRSVHGAATRKNARNHTLHPTPTRTQKLSQPPHHPGWVFWFLHPFSKTTPIHQTTTPGRRPVLENDVATTQNHQMPIPAAKSQPPWEIRAHLYDLHLTQQVVSHPSLGTSVSPPQLLDHYYCRRSTKTDYQTTTNRSVEISRSSSNKERDQH